MLSVQLVALYHLGMVLGSLEFKGFAKSWILMTFFGGSNMQKYMKMHDEHGSVLVSGALNPRKMIS